VQAPPHEDEDIATCAAGPKLPTRTHHAALAITARIETAEVTGATPALGVAGDVRGLLLVLAEMASGCGGGGRLLCYQLARYVNASSGRFEPLLKGSKLSFKDVVAGLERGDLTTARDHSEFVLQAFADRFCVNVQRLSPVNWQAAAPAVISFTAANAVTVYVAALEKGYAAVVAL
jgi:hypothetical protein